MSQEALRLQRGNDHVQILLDLLLLTAAQTKIADIDIVSPRAVEVWRAICSDSEHGWGRAVRHEQAPALVQRLASHVLYDMLAEEKAPAEAHRERGPDKVQRVVETDNLSIHLLADETQLACAGTAHAEPECKVPSQSKTMERIFYVTIAQIYF